MFSAVGSDQIDGEGDGADEHKEVEEGGVADDDEKQMYQNGKQTHRHPVADPTVWHFPSS